MVDDSALEYVKKHLKKGFSEKKIAERLKKSGYSEEAVRRIVAMVRKKESGTPGSRHPKRFHYTAAGVIAVIAIFFAFYALTMEAPLAGGEEEGRIPLYFSSIKESLEGGGTLYAGYALAVDSFLESNKSMCGFLGSEDFSAVMCNEYYDILTSMKNLADGKCDDIDFITQVSFGVLDYDICAAISSGDCGTLDAEQKEVCSHALAKDGSLCLQFEDPEECRMIFSTLFAIRGRDTAMCGAIGHFLNREACIRIAEKRGSLLDDTIMALAISSRAKETGDAALCRGIAIGEMEAMCQDSEVSYTEILENLQSFTLFSY